MRRPQGRLGTGLLFLDVLVCEWGLPGQPTGFCCSVNLPTPVPSSNFFLLSAGSATSTGFQQEAGAKF